MSLTNNWPKPAGEQRIDRGWGVSCNPVKTEAKEDPNPLKGSFTAPPIIPSRAPNGAMGG